jgi:hypothetical protein
VPWVATNNVPDHDVNKVIEPTRVHALVRFAQICLDRSGKAFSTATRGSRGDPRSGEKIGLRREILSRGLSIFMDHLYAKILITNPNST